MSEENKLNEGTLVPGEAAPSPIVEEALHQGWVPKDEFDGDPERWVDAGEFVRRGELFRKIESQSKEIKDVKRALNELAKHNAKVREVEYERALQELKSQKKEALSEGDADRVVDVDERIDLIKDQQKQLQSQKLAEVQQEIVNPEFARWTSKNSWYETDKRMRAYADTLGLQLAQEGLSPSEVLKEVEKEVKDRFKEKFRNPNRDKPGAVEGVTARAAKSSEADYELSDVEKTIMKTLVDGGHMTKEDYVKQLKAVKAKG